MKTYSSLKRGSLAAVVDCKMFKKTPISDLPLILILSVYTDFLPSEFGKYIYIYIKYRFFFWNAKGFSLYHH